VPRQKFWYAHRNLAMKKAVCALRSLRSGLPIQLNNNNFAWFSFKHISLWL